MKCKKGNSPLWSVTRIRDPRYPGITLRITEIARTDHLYVARMVDGKQRVSVLHRDGHLSEVLGHRRPTLARRWVHDLLASAARLGGSN